jgi:hypothetical protein
MLLTQLPCFQAIPNSCSKIPGVGCVPDALAGHPRVGYCPTPNQANAKDEKPSLQMRTNNPINFANVGKRVAERGLNKCVIVLHQFRIGFGADGGSLPAENRFGLGR